MNDREKLAELLFEAMISCYYGCGYDDVADHLIANDVVVRKQGEWVDGMKCSNCEQIDWSKPPYCPNCGAKMKEVR